MNSFFLLNANIEKTNAAIFNQANKINNECEMWLASRWLVSMKLSGLATLSGPDHY